MKKYHGKILLFGEYTVILEGAALAIPTLKYSGSWINGHTNDEWGGLINYLEQLPQPRLDTKALKRDLKSGITFISTIPRGKGLGSSGALVAALYDRYDLRRESHLKIVQKNLGLLESFYHGQSSGVDPLVSWANAPLLIEADGSIKTPQVPQQDWQESERFALFDSEVSRLSAPLIKVFKEKCVQIDYQKRLQDLKTLVAEGIDRYLHFDEAQLGLIFHELSSLELDLFTEMIPSGLKEIWRDGLESREYSFKLCGAGGGGYFICYRHKKWPDLKLEPF